MITHASIIPLIGGETLGSEISFSRPPEYFMSFEAFWTNDRHIVNYYQNEIPYYVLDKNEKPNKKVDVIASVCPCAGLSQLSHGYGDENPNNEWMIKTAKYVLSEVKPKVFWGENAPGLAGKIGKNIRDQLYKIAIENGYTMTLYRTRSLLHGVAQVRERTFYFFWQGNKTPLLEYYNRPYKPIETVILEAKGNTLNESINKKIPSNDPYYQYILQEIHNNITHREYSNIVEPSKARGNDVFGYIEKTGHDYLRVAEWMSKNGFEREAASCKRKYDKLASGGQIMRRGTIIPKDYIGAFVGHYPTSLTHPIEDRYISYREALSIMGHPINFELLDPKNSYNHICQNVPVYTAADMAKEVKLVLEGKRNFVDSSLVFQYNNTKSHTVLEKSNNLEEFF
jgi:site-specific DNA-cytosine methylase